MTKFQNNRNFKKFLCILMIITLTFTLFRGFVSDTKATDTDFEASIADFPESYKPMLRQLHESHPNWTFVAFDTGLDWDVVLENEMVLSRNLVPNGIMGINGKWFSTPTSWKDTTITGSYNWSGNDWVELCGGGWVQASTEAVSYVMDPRNWLTEENIFAFEMLSYNETYQTYALLKKMMDDTFMDCDYATVGGTSNRTYASVLIEAGKAYGVSPVHLCARIIQEKGKGTYNSSTGQYKLKDTLATGVKGTDGVTYYNFFNIGASGSTTEAVIANGTAEAQNAGWTSQYKSILGGASKVSNNYIKIGQDTIYFQKFSVVDPAYYYWKQYMQNLLAPVNEGYNTYKAYNTNGILDSNFVFRIPVYNNMPETACEQPTGDGNPNYKLKSLYVKGISMDGTTTSLSLTPTFNMDTATYSIIVPYETSKIYIMPYAIAGSTSTISGNGTKTLNVGKNTFKIVCKSEYGTSKTYTLSVTRSAGSTYLTALSTSVGSFKETFSKTQYNYTMSVGSDVKTLDLYYGAESSTAYVEYRNGDTTTACSGGTVEGITLSEGVNTIYLDVYPSETDKSSKKTYSIQITRHTTTTFNKKSLQLSEDATMIYGFTLGDTVTKALGKMEVINGSIVIKDSKGKEKAKDAVIATGDVVWVLDGNGLEYKKYTIVIFGDVNGDGKIDLFDFAYMKKQILKKSGLSGVYYIAGDTYAQSEGVDLYDIAVIKRYILKNVAIPQTR